MKHTIFCVIGGDRRQSVLCSALSQKGETVYLLANQPEAHDNKTRICHTVNELPKEECAVILPMPAVGSNGLIRAVPTENAPAFESIFPRLAQGSVVFGGMLSQTFTDCAKQHGISCVDMSLWKDLTAWNGKATAEAALAMAIEVLPRLLSEASILLLGYGNIGKALASLLVFHGSKITVLVRRKEVREEAQKDGCSVCTKEALPLVLPYCHLVINTIPAPLLTESELSLLRKGTPLIELASGAGGFSAESAKKLGLYPVSAPGLPGKYSPVSAGEKLADCILSYLTSCKNVTVHRRNP